LSERPIGRFNWPARKQCAYVSFAFGHGRFKRDQAIGKAGLELAAAETPLQQEGTAMILRSLVACLSLSAGIIPSAVYAADAASCAKPHFSDVGSTDITATTQIANQILTNLGYKPNITVLSVAVTFQSLQNGDIDVFLGNWSRCRSRARRRSSRLARSTP
jgi:hypothetical protein